MSEMKLEKLKGWVRGNGVVIRHGYKVCQWGKPSRSRAIWSGAKPLISATLLRAVKEGRIQSVDEPVAKVEERLLELNGGKDAGITWRHLANMTSGYGLSEPPGAAYAYNDEAITLYLYTLSRKVFFMDGTNLLHEQLAKPLGFENPVVVYDDYLATARGVVSISSQDMARFGLLVLRDGKWGDKRILPAASIEMMLNSPVPESMPLSSGKETAILDGLPCIGAGRNQSPHGPGLYSFNWWLNREDKNGRRPLPSAPQDAVLATGIWGRDVLLIIPSLDIVAAWDRAEFQDFQDYDRRDHTRMDHAAYLLCTSVTKPEL